MDYFKNQGFCAGQTGRQGGRANLLFAIDYFSWDPSTVLRFAQGDKVIFWFSVSSLVGGSPAGGGKLKFKS